MARQANGDQLKKLTEENLKLKTENVRLRGSMSPKEAKPKRKNPLEVLRKVGIVLFVSLAVALVFVGNIVFWTGSTIVNTDKYIATVGPLIKDSQVQNSLALYATNQIFNNVDVNGYVTEVLPPRAAFLAPQLTSQLRTVTNNTIKKALQNPNVQNFWLTLQRKQHERIITFAKNYKGSGTISLNDLYRQLSDRLKSTKLSFLANKQLPSKVGSITVINATWLPTFHNIVTHINTWRILTLLIMLVSLGLAIFLARRRRRIVYVFSWAAAGAMFVTLVGVRLMRDVIASHADPQYADGVRQAVKIVLHPLVIQTALILLAALVIVFIAWVSGPTKGSRKLKAFVQGILGGELHYKLFGGREGAFITWIQTYKRIIDWTIVGIGALVLLIAKLTPTSLLVYVLVTAALVLIVEIVGGTADHKQKTGVKN